MAGMTDSPSPERVAVEERRCLERLERRDRIGREVAVDPHIFDLPRWRRVSANGFEPNTDAPEDSHDPDPEEVRLAHDWLDLHVVRTMHIAPRHSYSYGCKHRVENWTETFGPHNGQIDPSGRRWGAPYHYISNGAFIRAALDASFTARRCCPGCLNGYFNFTCKRPPKKPSHLLLDSETAKGVHDRYIQKFGEPFTARMLGTRPATLRDALSGQPVPRRVVECIHALLAMPP
jgi:hypothetical protein